MARPRLGEFGSWLGLQSRVVSAERLDVERVCGGARTLRKEVDALIPIDAEEGSLEEGTAEEVVTTAVDSFEGLAREISLGAWNDRGFEGEVKQAKGDFDREVAGGCF